MTNLTKVNAEVLKHLQRYRKLVEEDLSLEDPFLLLKETQKIKAALDALVVFLVYKKGLEESQGDGAP